MMTMRTSVHTPARSLVHSMRRLHVTRSELPSCSPHTLASTSTSTSGAISACSYASSSSPPSTQRPRVRAVLWTGWRCALRRVRDRHRAKSSPSAKVDESAAALPRGRCGCACALCGRERRRQRGAARAWSCRSEGPVGGFGSVGERGMGWATARGECQVAHGARACARSRPPPCMQVLITALLPLSIGARACARSRPGDPHDPSAAPRSRARARFGARPRAAAAIRASSRWPAGARHGATRAPHRPHGDEARCGGPRIRDPSQPCPLAGAVRARRGADRVAHALLGPQVAN